VSLEEAEILNYDGPLLASGVSRIVIPNPFL
jgi:hypothetical protein